MTIDRPACPICGSHYFGAILKDGPYGIPEHTGRIRCHGSGSDAKPYVWCGHVYEWPKEDAQE